MLQHKLVLTFRKCLDAWYGKGVYFATTSRTSNGYAKPDVNGKKRMFLAEVITGEYCQGQSSMATAPFKTQTQAYDSVVDNMNTIIEIVVFRDASVYPMYLLTY